MLLDVPMERLLADPVAWRDLVVPRSYAERTRGKGAFSRMGLLLVLFVALALAASV